MKNPIPLFLIPLAETAGVNASRSSDKQFAQFVKKSLGRYFFQDWGEMCEEDKKANNWSLNHDERILASYSDKENDYKIWSDYKYAGLPFDIWNLMNPWYVFDAADGKVEKGEN